MKKESEKARTRFHAKFKALLVNPQFERVDTGDLVKLDEFVTWGAKVGGWSFVISRDLGAVREVETQKVFTISIRHVATQLEAVFAFEKFTSLTAAKDACYNYYCQYRREMPKLRVPRGRPRKGDPGVQIRMRTGGV